MRNEDLYPKEAEAIVIGQVLYEPGCIGRAARLLRPEHFFDANNRTVYEAALGLWKEGRKVDLVTMAHALRQNGTLERIGGPAQLVEFTTQVAQTTHLEDHAGIVREQYGLRILRDTGLRIAEHTDMSADPDELISDMNASAALASAADMNTDVNAGDRGYAMQNETKQKPTYFGMDKVDDHVFMLPGNMITISAPSGVGKTAFALSAVLNLIDTHKPWIVSLEMPADELITRALCQLAEVEISAALQDKMSDGDRDRLAKAANEHAGILSRITIDDAGHMTIDAFRAKAEYKVKNEGVKLIVVDYAQLMEADHKEHRGTAAQNEAISKGLRATCRALNVILLVVVHVNREGEAHGSVQYEKDAHVRIKLSKDKGASEMQVDLLKNRNGATCGFKTPCDLRYGLIGRTAGRYNPTPSVPHPDNRITARPTDDPAPF